MSPSDTTLEAEALSLLDEALERPSGQRAGWARERTAAEPQLQARLLALLAAAERDDGALVTGGAGASLVEPPPPERIGAYRIVERVGQGGMGAVYRAERDAGDFSHVVAIKIIRPGVLSEALVERFARERQTLADLAHPHIARLFDGGQTADGQPFIVMEYVAGRPITAWARDRGLPVRSRLQLFLDACEAVRFAHQNLVIHRDLTPANVLVTDAGVVKLIDFGIARPPESAGGESPSRASIAGLSLTPGFAAPERLTGAGASTLVDVYSLGRLLDTLLEDLPSDPDLVAIARRAAADDPAARYPSVDALIDDVRRHLDGRAVAARGGGPRYAFGKWVRRHHRAVAASSAGLAVLVGALVAALIAYGVAERARAAEAQRFGELRELASYMLFDLDRQLARTPGNTAARVALAAEAQQYLSRLAATRAASPAVRLDTARGLIRLAQIQGVPPDPNFGEFEAAKGSLAAAEQLLAELEADGLPARTLAPERARIAAHRAQIAGNHDSDNAGAAQLIKAAWPVLDAVPAAERDAGWRDARTTLRAAEAEVASLSDDLPGLDRIANAMDADVAAWPAAEQRSPAAEEQRAIALYWRGAAESFSQTDDQGVAELTEASRRFRALEAARPRDPHLLYWAVYADYTLFAANADREGESFATLERARANIGRLLAVESQDNALQTLAVNIDEAYGQALANLERFDEALAIQRSVVDRATRKLAAERTPTAIGDVGWRNLILGLNARKAGDRRTTCDAWTVAEARFVENEKLGKLQGFHAGFLPGLRANLARCRAGAPISAFTPLR